MITVTRRNGTSFALNPDLIERVESTPDTVITLVSGTRYVVSESVEAIVDEVCGFRAAVLNASATPVQPRAPKGHLRSVSTPEN
ncbi:flagellar FlbD family protein [Agilicoccus flavus]|uniref:flagellar FlbD family protein n=1 Tax=Agilicoccus flavus TaxID=2775968 RepID=UPI001CF6ACC1|nr:flagellar FlbD family protein [Agilicoccus flavus]